MDFKPYDDELEVINNIHKYNNNDYMIIRLTKTMIEKNNIDANVFLRDLLYDFNIVDYNVLPFDGNQGIVHSGTLLYNDIFKNLRLKFYRTKTRGDKRFSISGIRNLFQNNVLNIGDLLYITIHVNNGNPEIKVINVTNNIPTDENLSLEFGLDTLNEALGRLIPQIRFIAQEGYHKNISGEGKVSPKDVGDTLESLLGIRTNNSQHADFENLIEIKSKSSGTLDTLFTLRPRFESTPVAEFEPNDRSRVSAFARMYGYESEKHAGKKSLYITIGSELAPQNQQGFYLNVNDEERTVELIKSHNNTSIITAYWTFNDLERELHQKHPATLWVKAKIKPNSNPGEFLYHHAILTRSPQFMTFIALIKKGIITYDWRGYTTTIGKYSGKSHGNAWRIKPKHRHLLFGSTEIINLQG